MTGMLAAILTAQREPLVLDEVRQPERLDFGQVLVRVAYSGVCGSQIGEIDGVKGEDCYLPHLLGHEGAGTVEATGPAVTRVRPGDRVVMHWMRGEGIEGAPPRYRWGNRDVNAGWVTTFNERAVVSENRLTPAPEGIPLALAPLFGCAVTTGFGVVVNDARLRVGESLVVLGAGGIGLSVIQAGVLAGAHPIVAVDLHGPKLELATRLGATHAIDASGGDLATAVRAVAPEGADVVVDNTGDVRVIETAYELAGPQGRTILVGVPSVRERARLYTLPLHFGKVLTGSHGGAAQPSHDIPRYARLALAGKLHLEDLITNRYSLSEINTAIDDLRNGRVSGRALIEIEPEH